MNGYLQREIEAIHDHLPDSVALLDDPEALAYLTNLDNAPRLLHLASHTVQREDMPLFTALELTGNLLSVEQCYTLPLQGTELVTLSGCDTASGMESGGSLLAFQSAFFVAGAQQVVSTLWPINDEATCHWMDHFYQALATSVPPAVALQQAQQRCLTDPAYAHPAIWAAFICSGR